MQPKVDADQNGFWLTTDEQPLIRVHADQQFRNDKRLPITVFWGGETDADRLRRFFKASYQEAALSPSAIFRTIILAHHEKKELGTIDIPQSIQAGAEFVRLEHLPSLAAPKEAADFVVWATLEKPVPKTADNVGVYFSAARLYPIFNLLAEFISDTAAPKVTFNEAGSALKQVAEALDHI